LAFVDVEYRNWRNLVRKNTQTAAYKMNIALREEVSIRSIGPEQTYPLRHQILWPDKPVDYIKLDDDPIGYHYGAFRADELVAVISLFMTGGTAHFRKFATRPDQQRQGIGTRLMQHIETEARQRGATQLWCDARLNVASFYQRFGMETSGEVFFRETIPCIKFQKSL